MTLRAALYKQQQAPDLAIGFMLLKPDQIKREQHLSMTPNGNDASGGWEEEEEVEEREVEGGRGVHYHLCVPLTKGELKGKQWDTFICMIHRLSNL